MVRKRDRIIGMIFLVGLGMSCLYVLSGSEDRRTGGHSSVDWMWNDYDAAMIRARAENTFVLIDFWAVWCKECKEMDEKGFQTPEVVQLLEGVVLLKVDIDEVPQLKAQFGVRGMPTIVVVNAHGEEVARAVGYQTAEQLTHLLEEGLQE
jgi:thiol:disulfide interchange protein